MIKRKKENIDLLAIGDIAVDDFIKIEEVEKNCDINGHCKLCFRFADKIPYKSSEICYATGNSPNVAISTSKLGLNTYLISYVGEDLNGKKSINSLKQNNVKIDYLETIKNLSTNYHYILWHDRERTILTNHTEFPYSFPKDLSEPKWIYLSSLAINSENYHNEILKYLKSHPKIKLAFQPGTFQMKLGVDKLKGIYKRSEIFFCNLEEAQKIIKTNEKDYFKLMNMLFKLGPKIIVLTDGIKGSYSYDGINTWHMKAFPQIVYEKTGAGDAFSSAFVGALFWGKTIEEALMWGSTNAISVISQLGPHKGLLSKKQIEEYLKKVSKDNKPIKLN